MTSASVLTITPPLDAEGHRGYCLHVSPSVPDTVKVRQIEVGIGLLIALNHRTGDDNAFDHLIIFNEDPTDG